MAMIAKCGGFLYDENVFQEIDGVLTLANSDTVAQSFLAKNCGGQKFDSDVFYEAKIGKSYVIGMLDESKEQIPVENIFKISCSLLFDKDIFKIGENKELTINKPSDPDPSSEEDTPDIEDDEHTEEYDPEDF